MFYKIHYNVADICPSSYIQYANHISGRTDHPLKYCNNTLQINAYKYFSAVSHMTSSVDDFHKFTMPAIRVMQPLHGAALI